LMTYCFLGMNHPPSTQCFGTDVVYKIYLILKVKDLIKLMIMKIKEHPPCV
jgi:hypothetical protein